MTIVLLLRDIYPSLERGVGGGGGGGGSEPCLMSAHLFDLMGRTREQHQQTKQHHRNRQTKNIGGRGGNDRVFF